MAKKTIWDFLRDQRTKVPPVAQADLRGKTVIVVGANTGLGFEAAQHFARIGAGKLILACRNQEKGEAALRRLEEATGYSEAELWLLDLAEFASVKAFVDRALRDLERLDILLLNAAMASVMNGLYAATKDGLEMALQVNSLSGPLLALLLLPHMLDTAKQFGTVPRIVVVSSEVHYWASIDDKVLESPNAIQLMGSQEYCTPNILNLRYVESKLLNVFFTRALNNHLKDTSLIVNIVDPGFCYSEIHRNMRSILVTLLEKLLARTAEEGARQLVWAAVGVPDEGVGTLDDLRGAYINLAQINEPADFVLGEQGKKWEDKLWADLISILEKVDSRVQDVVAQHLS